MEFKRKEAADGTCRPRGDAVIADDQKLALEYRLLDGLIPYARNARTHSEEQVAQIASSIREFGWTNPILVDGDNGIIAGHGRLLAARKLSITEVPVIELAGMTEAQKRAYIIADNKLALNAGWDTEMLAIEFGDLAGLGFDLSLTGFGDDELAAIMNGCNPGPSEVRGRSAALTTTGARCRADRGPASSRRRSPSRAKVAASQNLPSTRRIWRPRCGAATPLAPHLVR